MLHCNLSRAFWTKNFVFIMSFDLRDFCCNVVSNLMWFEFNCKLLNPAFLRKFWQFNYIFIIFDAKMFGLNLHPESRMLLAPKQCSVKRSECFAIGNKCVDLSSFPLRNISHIQKATSSDIGIEHFCEFCFGKLFGLFFVVISSTLFLHRSAHRISDLHNCSFD